MLISGYLVARMAFVGGPLETAEAGSLVSGADPASGRPSSHVGHDPRLGQCAGMSLEDDRSKADRVGVRIERKHLKP
jgi:hypothetical protein